MLNKKQELRLSSSLDDLHKVERFVDSICDEFNINNNYFGNIIIALTEAVTNSIVHGNNQDKSKTVTVTFEHKPKGLIFTIKDEGKGFDHKSIPDPTDVEKCPNPEEGRGMFLIKSLSDEVVFSDNGSKIEIIFKISSINKELALDRAGKLKSYYTEKQNVQKAK